MSIVSGRGSAGLIGFSIRRRVTVAMATVTLLLFGLIALKSLRVTLLPDLSYPTLTVRTDYVGAAPMEIETLVTRPVEEALGVVRGLRKLESVSRTGQSDVVLQFAWGTNMDQAGLEVRDKLEALQLPQDARPPVILRFNPSTEPVMRLALSARGGDDPRTLAMLRRYAEEDLKKKLEPVAGVAAVKVAGGLEDEIQVDLDQQKLAQLGIPVATVIQRLQQENVNVSAGRLEQGTQRYLVRTVNQFDSVDAIRDMLLNVSAAGNRAASSAAQQMARVAAATGSADAMAAAAAVAQAAGGGNAVPAGGVPVRLGDVATVRQGFKEREAIIRLGGHEAVELAIYKEGDANTVSTVDAIASRLELIRSTLPAGVDLGVIDDQSQFIRSAIHSLEVDALVGGLLAVLVIFLFLRDGWSTLVVGLSLPVSIIGTFFFMGRFGLSLNVMSLGGLALATGLVVDDSIVVLESIAKARERGLGVLQAAQQGAREVGMAVMASTLTTVAVFLPLVFVEGVAGQLFRDQALTVAIAVLISLLVSMSLIPMLSGLKQRPPLAFAEEPPYVPPQRPRLLRVLGWPGRALRALVGWLVLGGAWLLVRAWRLLSGLVGPLMRLASDAAMHLYQRAESAYLRLLPAALRHPGRVLGAALCVFMLVMATVPLLGTDLIPQLAQDRFDMTLKLPPGTTLARTDAAMRQLQQAHAGDPGVHALYAVSGSGTRLDASPTESGENIGKLTVIMSGGGDTHVETAETERLRRSVLGIPGAQADFSRPELISLSRPLEVELAGDNLAEIEHAGRRLAAWLRGDEHFADVRTSVEQGFPEVQIRFDAARAAALGMTTRQIADIVVDKIGGNVATRYSDRDRKIDVLVRARPQDRDSVSAIRNLVVNPGSGTPVTLGSVAQVIETEGPSEIHRADQTRVAVVSANLRGIDLGGAIARVRGIVAQHPLGPDIRMSIGGQGEELAGSMRSLLFAFGLAVFLVYLVMASQFESLLHPFVILFTIPLAMVGAVLALLLTHSTLSVVVFIGLILLVGLVAKNAIILIDKVNQLREAGVAKHEAIIGGAGSRLRPIMMTTLCSVFGFMPLALSFGDGAEVRSPMAITVIGGLAVATLLTLLVIPVVYDLLDRRPDAYYQERGRRAQAAEAELDAGDPAAQTGRGGPVEGAPA